MTKNGKQKTPDWLAGALGMTEEQKAALQEQAEAGGGMTIEQLLGPRAE